MRTLIKSALLTLSALVTLTMTGCADLTPCERGALGCICNELDNPATCDDAGAVCAAGICIEQPGFSDATVCYNACAYRTDGVCDDGMDLPENSACGLGSDCADCGVRANPFVGMTDSIFCPQTPSLGWPSNVNCYSVRTCDDLAAGMRGPFGCPAGQAIDCNAVGGAKCVAFSGCPANAPTPCINENSCIGPQIDCNSLTMCGSATVGCYTGETVICAGSSGSCMP
jgi:hypothetical protein